MTENLDAIAARGKALLRDHPGLREGLDLTMQAAEAGHPDAEALFAVYAAAGAGLPQSWTTAFNYLRRAAEHGNEDAQRQLIILAGGSIADTGKHGHWRTLPPIFDSTTLLRTPQRHIVCAGPRVATLNGFATPALCDWLIARAKDRLEPARVYDPTTDSRVENARSNSAYHVPLAESDVPLRLLQARIAAATERAIGDLESPALLHYEVGQEFTPHVDFLDTKIPSYAQQVAERGQRVVTFLLYLNDDYEGGETDFPMLRWQFKGRKGDAMFFWSVEPNGAADPRTLHAGLPPTRGEKWLLSQWLRARPPGRGF